MAGVFVARIGTSNHKELTSTGNCAQHRIRHRCKETCSMSAGVGNQMLRTQMKSLEKARRFTESKTGDKETKHFLLVGFCVCVFVCVCLFWVHFVKEQI